MEEKEEIEILTKKLIKKIESNPEECISILKSELLGDKINSITYEEYLHQLQSTLKKCTCQASWNHSQIAMKCLDCQTDSSSCICVNCFLKGNHQGHRVRISHSTGTCDCGDPIMWLPKGFCPDHPGPESDPEQTQLTKETRIKLISICKASISNYITYASTKSPLFTQITDFLFNLISIGDATRRCVSLAIKETFSIYELYINSIDLEASQMKKLITLIQTLTNDRIFRDYFSLSFLSDLPKFIKFNDSLINMDQTKRNSAASFYKICFHATSIPIVSLMIKNDAFNWSDIFKKSLDLLLELNLTKHSKEYSDETLFSNSWFRIINIMKAAFQIFDSKSSKIIELTDQIASIFIKYESGFKFTRVFGETFYDPEQTQRAVFDMIFKNYSYVNKIVKKNVLTKKPLFLLDNFFKGELFQSIDKFYKSSIDDFHFRSVLNANVDLSQCFPIHILAFYCINYRDRKSFSETLSEVTDNIEKFIRDWAVIPLRFVAAAELCDYRFFAKNCSGEIIALDSFKFKRNIAIKFAPAFSMIQQFLKTTKSVDDFLLMIISTFGFFNSVRNEEEDDETKKLDENQNRNLLFVIYNFVLCLIFDTFCYEKNFFAMWRLAVISELMKKDLTMDQINSIWYKNIHIHENYSDDLANFTSRVVINKETKFHLKDKSGWHPLLPFMTLSSIIPLVQKFIDENPDSLINFPSIPNDSICLLFSPTLWALHYHILSHNCCKNNQVIQQFVLNALIVTSQNSEIFYKDKNAQESNKNPVLNVDGFCDLASQLKNFAFNDFLTVKVVYSKSEIEPKSMVDLIRETGNIGITVLTRLNLSDIGEYSIEENQQKKEEMMKKNRERAKQLKMQIMSNFATKQKSFQRSSSVQENEEEDEKEEVENPSKMECSICHLDNEEDCFVYPALVYKNSLQSYIKWRFRNAQIGRELDNDFSEIPDSFSCFSCVRICLHPIHSKCIHTKVFSCPSDRCLRNTSIPIIDGIYDEKTELDAKVYSQAENFLQKAYYKSLRFALYSLASQIEILEMRHRSNPGCLDEVVIQPTLRNIYLCIWHVMRKEAANTIEVEKSHDYNKVSNDDKSIDKITLNALSLSGQRDVSFLDDDVSQFAIHLKMNKDKIKFTPLMFYIASFLIDKNVELDSFASDDFVFDFKDDLNSDYKWLQFLRCAAIFDHFARGCKITQTADNEFIDWDVILSPSNLCKYYNIHRAFNGNRNIDSNINSSNANNNDSNANNNDSSANNNDSSANNNDLSANNNDSNANNNDSNTNNNESNANNNDSNTNNNDSNANNNDSNTNNNESNANNDSDDNNEMSLPMFSFIDLPKNFLDFVHPPFSAPILESSDCEIFLCLLTGKTVVKNSESLPSSTHQYGTISNLLKGKFDDSFTVFLKLNGSKSSQVAIGHMDLNQICNISPFYTDKFGESDIGMKRGSLLYLNEPILEEIIDGILSGSWTNLVHLQK